jgi:hypothetical protein
VTNDFHLCITFRHDKFQPALEEILNLVDFLDYGFFLEGPDRNLSAFVPLSMREAEKWSEYQRDDVEMPIKPHHKRSIYMLYSPAAPDEPYGNYNYLHTRLNNLIPREQPFVATLGRGTRKLMEVLYTAKPNEQRRWVDSFIVHIVRGPHPVWHRIWNIEENHREWELLAVKSFFVMVEFKVNSKADFYRYEDYVDVLRNKENFLAFLTKFGNLVNNYDFELLGGAS